MRISINRASSAAIAGGIPARSAPATGTQRKLHFELIGLYIERQLFFDNGCIDVIAPVSFAKVHKD